MIQEQINGEKLRFKEIFEKKFSGKKDKYTLKKIVIPELQRDYAQGRKTASVNGIRENLLNDIKNKIQSKEELTLDFIYGKIQGEDNDEMELIPLDGQQRLTTLFLLNWYAINSFELRGEQRPNESDEFNLKSKFSYQSRPSARDFCTFLSETYKPQIKEDSVLSEDIRNDIEFPESWEDDPSVDSMLVMLDAIHEKFKNVDNMYSGLNSFIHFYFLPIEDMGASDSLYIKMNSRGRALTDFEIAKAILKKYMDELPEIDDDFNKNLMNNFDGKWTDALWNIVDKDASKLDNAYLIYLKYICDVLCLQNRSLELKNRIPKEQNWSDDITINDLIKKYFSKENVHAVDNLKKLNEYLSCLPYIAEFNYNDFFYSDMYENEKVKDFNNNEYSTIIKNTLNGKIKAVEVKDFSKIYFLLSYIRNFKVNDSISTDENEIKRRFRIIRNLIQHSDDEIAIRKEKNTFPATLEQIDYIIKYGKINDDIKIEIDKTDTDNTEDEEKTQPQPFNSQIKKEEKEKAEWLKEHQEYRDSVYKLEDNEMLKGKISIVGWDNPKYFDRFEKLFKCDCEKIDRALMAIGDTIYGVDIRSKNQFGSEKPTPSWYNIFANWDKIDFEDKYHNKMKLQTLLDIEKLDLITSDGKGVEEAQEELDNICNEFLNTDKYDFRYYYVKYKSFRPKESGKYDYTNDYEVMVQPTSDRLSPNSYQPFLKECENEKNKRKPEKWGLVALNLDEDKIIKCIQSGFEIEDLKTKEKRFIDIAQDENNTDVEDRIEKLNNILNTPVTDVWNKAECRQN